MRERDAADRRPVRIVVALVVELRGHGKRSPRASARAREHGESGGVARARVGLCCPRGTSAAVGCGAHELGRDEGGREEHAVHVARAQVEACANARTRSSELYRFGGKRMGGGAERSVARTIVGLCMEEAVDEEEGVQHHRLREVLLACEAEPQKMVP